MICSCIRLLIWRLRERMNRRFSIRLQNFVPSLLDAENLMFKEKLPVGGILHVRGHSYIFHTLVFFRFYGGGVGGVVRPCPLFSWGRGKRCAGCCLRHMLSVRLQAAFPLSGFSVFGAATFFSVFSAVCCFSASLAAFFSAFFISFILSSKRSCRF